MPDLSTTATQEQCDILFIGEGPGVVEDIESMPFLGPAGILLRKSIVEANIDLTSTGFTNLLLCRPYAKTAMNSANRAPSSGEVVNCMPRLIDHIRSLNPTLLVLLGKEPESYWPMIREELSEHLHTVYATAMYHPSYIARKGGTGTKEYEEYVATLKDIFQWYRTVGKTRLYTPQPNVPSDLLEFPR